MLTRRAALRSALRRGDAVSAAHWWDRMRVDVASLTPDEIRMARAARASMGRAIRDARVRRAQPEPAFVEPTGVVIPFPRDGQPFRRAMLGLALFTLAALAVVIFGLPNLRESPAPAAAAPELVKPVATLSPAGGRGRVTATVPPVAAVPLATPVPTPAPTEAPATPPPAAAAVSEAPAPQPVAVVPASTPAVGGQPGGVPGGVAGGTPGGVAGGAPGGTGTRPIGGAPAPSYIPAGTPPPQPQGADRFYFKIVDSASRAPLANICVIYGLIACVYSNASGLYWIDVDPNASRWSFLFQSADYWPATIIETYQPGMGSVPTTVYLRHR